MYYLFNCSIPILGKGNKLTCWFELSVFPNFFVQNKWPLFMTIFILRPFKLCTLNFSLNAKGGAQRRKQLWSNHLLGRLAVASSRARQFYGSKEQGIVKICKSLKGPCNKNTLSQWLHNNIITSLLVTDNCLVKKLSKNIFAHKLCRNVSVGDRSEVIFHFSWRVQNWHLEIFSLG